MLYSKILRRLQTGIYIIKSFPHNQYSETGPHHSGCTIYIWKILPREVWIYCRFQHHTCSWFWGDILYNQKDPQEISDALELEDENGDRIDSRENVYRIL